MPNVTSSFCSIDWSDAAAEGYKRQVTELYETDEEEEEVTSSFERQKPTPADDDTRVVKHRCTGARVTPTSADTSQDYCNSPPAAQELPWGPLFEDVSDDDDDDVIASSPAHDDDEDAIASSPSHEDDDDDDDFTFSPASPPLTQRTEEERTMTVPITLYVFPDETVVLKPDGGCDRIADKHTITQPKPSTSTIEDDDNDEDESAADQARKVCFMKMEKTIAQIITNQWWASTPSTVEEVTVDVCQTLAATMLSAAFQAIMMAYARSNIRLDSRRL